MLVRDGTVLVSSSAVEWADWSELARDLGGQVCQLRQQVANRRRDNFDRRPQVGDGKSMPARSLNRARKWETEVEPLGGANRQLQDQLSGPKSDKPWPRDRSHRLDGDADQPAASQPPKRGQPSDHPGPKRRDHSPRPVLEELREWPHDQRFCRRCGRALVTGDSEDSEPIEVHADRRRIRRPRDRRTCDCPVGPRTFTVPPAPKLIPKGLFGVLVWAEVLLDQFASPRPTERWLASWRWLGRNGPAGTVAEGRKRLEPRFDPLYKARLPRNAGSRFAQADETRWMVVVTPEGKRDHQWCLWVFLGADTVVYRLDPSRSHEVPQRPFPNDTSVVLTVDRHASDKAMAQVKAGHATLAFCWVHVRRDFVRGARAGTPQRSGPWPG